MNRTASLSGDTLVACHFPLVQLSPWQLPVQAALCNSSTKQPGRLCSSSVALTRAASLPEQDALREPFHSNLGHTSSSYWSLKEDRGEEDGDGDMGSISSGRCDSGSSPDETSQMITYQRHPGQHEGKGTSDQPEGKGTLRSHNSFLPSEEVDDGDSDGDNLHGYHEDASYVLQLHGNSNWDLGKDERTSTPCQPASQQNQGNWSRTVGMHCEPEMLEDVEDNMLKCGDEGYCFSYGRGECLPDSFSDGHLENVTDSSCNSSDGVLVNFSTIYDRSINPASPNNFSSHALLSSQPAGGSVLLNLHSFPQESQGPRADDSSQGVRTTSSPHDRTPSSPGSSSHTLDSNCNVYPYDVEGMLSSLEVSDITSCLQSQARQLPTGTTQKYYKLVTCDLSSRSASPSPAWSSTTSVTSEGHYFLFSKALGKQGEDLQEEAFDKEGRATPVPRPRSMTWDSSTAEPPDCKTNKPCQSSSHSNTSLDLCPIQEPLSLGNSGSCFPLLPHPKQHSSNVSHCNAVSADQGAVEEGACSWASPVERYSKAQRPTSLPIQPFVLLTPACQSQNQPLGSLLDRYISQKHTKPSSHLGSKCKGKVNRLPAHLRPSPLGSYGPNLLEGASSSETCSTCTPSPERFTSRRNWSHYSPYRSHTSPELNSSSPKQALITTKPLYAELTQGRSRQDRLYARDQRHTSPSHTYTNPNQFQQKDSIRRSQGMAQICQDLIRLSPEEPAHNPLCPTSTHVAPISPSTSHPCQPDLLSFSPDLALPPHHRTPLSQVTLTSSASSHRSLAAAVASVDPLSSLSSLLQPLVSLRVKQHCPLQPLVGSRVKQQQRPPQICNSFSLSDSKPPAEFSLSPDASYESLSISDLQRRGLLRSVSLAVDLIMTHFGTSRDPVEKTRLGNSSRSPTIGGLVLEHLCPTIQNILQDGLRDHRLDLIIGQRRNHAWIVVEASTQTGPTTRVLHSLLCKVRQCPLLANHCMRLRAFIMGLLNLRALEFWLNHLYNQKDVVAAHYHSWGFLAMSQGQCQPLFQELLLLLQPLSMLPFDLNLLLEPRLLHNRQLCSEEQAPPCSTFLMTSWPLLTADRPGLYGSDPHQLVQHLPGPAQATKPIGQERDRPVGQSSSGLRASSSPDWCQRQPVYTEWLVEGVECDQIDMDVIHSEPHPRRQARREDETSQVGRREGILPETTRAEADFQNKSPSHCRLRWAKLFGSGGDAPTRTQRASQNPNGSQFQKRRPSEWLHLDRSQLGMLAQTLWSGMLPRDRKEMPKTWVL